MPCALSYGYSEDLLDFLDVEIVSLPPKEKSLFTVVVEVMLLKESLR